MKYTIKIGGCWNGARVYGASMDSIPLLVDEVIDACAAAEILTGDDKTALLVMRDAIGKTTVKELLNDSMKDHVWPRYGKYSMRIEVEGLESAPAEREK